MYRIWPWQCCNKGCPRRAVGARMWTRAKHPKPGTWVYRAPVCKGCGWPGEPLRNVAPVVKKTLAELL
jgi:hypothetical protein